MYLNVGNTCSENGAIDILVVTLDRNIELLPELILTHVQKEKGEI